MKILSQLCNTCSCQTPRINWRGPKFIVAYVQVVRTYAGTLWPLKHYNCIAISFPPGLLHCGRGLKRQQCTRPQLRACWMAGIATGCKKAEMETGRGSAL